jgi:probable phosphoglycerate mutase
VTRRLLLLRHGRTAWNASGRIQGQLDPPLDELGQAQAALAARTVAALGPAAILSSDLQRALDGARLIGREAGLAVTADARLREINVGEWQGLTGVEARERFPEEYAAWRVGSDVRRGGGETYEEVGERAAAAAREMAAGLAPDELGVMVTHGGTARSLIGRILELPVEHWWQFAALGNCCYALLRESDRAWRLVEYGIPAASFDGGAAPYEAGPGTAADVEPTQPVERARP